ncbi:MAG: hypothetical protein HY557_07935, partial [Euryarchaeota archaeon]|nr:hypothetical protein [Euryarchaeota archaeon]
MAPPLRMFLLLVILFSLLSVDRAAAQPQGSAIVSSDLQLLSVTGAEGGGHVTWTFTGEQAELLRAKILGVFDSQLTIPRGFVYGERPTGATASTVGNGVIDSGEAGAFLGDLELELEGTLRGYEGVEFRYFKLRASDPLERGLPPERSSTGLVGTTLTTNQSLTIQFIFDGRALGSAGSFFQAGEAFVQALHSVLSFDAQGTLQESGCPPRCYPFPARNGWRRVDSPTPASWPAGPFLWHGNLGATPWVDTGAYLDGASNATFYSPDGIVESTVDLRFASAANLTFEHTG